nr:hypothetical protein [Micromonospora thermarum]
MSRRPAHVRTRIGWADLPHHVRAAVEDILGDRVVEAVSQPGGYSPGTADRVRTSRGTRAFVKAVSPAQNADSVRLHRTEARNTAALPAYAPAPRLLGLHDDGEWVALVLSDVAGRHPATPWRAAELTGVLRALETLSAALTPNPVPASSSTAPGDRPRPASPRSGSSSAPRPTPCCPGWPPASADGHPGATAGWVRNGRTAAGSAGDARMS